MDADKTVTANYTVVPRTLTVNSSGASGVAITSSTGHGGTTPYTKAGIANGASVSLTAPAVTGYTFTGWTGAVTSPNATVTLTMDVDKTMTANYVVITRTLTVNSSGASGVAITSTTGQGGTTPYTKTGLANGASVSLTAPTVTGYTFTGWTGAVTSSNATVPLTMDADKTVTANYTVVPRTLTVNSSGTAGVAITSSTGHGGTTPYAKAGIANGASVSLTAPAVNGYTFTGWTGAVTSPNATVPLTMDADKTVTANYVVITRTLTVNSSAASGVAITSTTGQGGTTPYTKTGLADGASVSLTAPAVTGYTFTGWTGAVTSSNVTIPLTMDADKTVTANYTYTDVTAPTVTLASVAPDQTNVSPIPFTATFSESVTGFALGDITVTNGTAGTFAGSGSSYSFVVTPASQGTVTVNIAAGVCQDAVGNPNTAAAALSRVYDTGPPAAVLASTATAATNVSPIPCTVTFSEGVTGFVLGDIGVTNGTAASFAGSGTSYSFVVTPGGQGTVTVNIGAGVCQDAASNLNTAAAALSRVFDSIPPSVTLSAPSSALASTGPVLYTVTYSGANTVTLAAGNVTLNRTGTANGNVAVTGSGSATRTVTISGLTGDGTLGISLATGSAADTAGNTAPAAGPSQTFVVAVSPVLAVSPATVSFGAVTLGDEAILSALVFNPGTASVTVQGVSATSTAFSVADFAGTLEAGEVLFLPVFFAPTAVTVYGGLLELTTAGGNIQVPLTGSGAGAPVQLEMDRVITPPIASGTLIDVPVRLVNATGLAVFNFRAEFDATRFEFVEFVEFVADTARVKRTPDVSTPSAAAVLVVVADLTGDAAVLAGDGLFGTLRVRSTAALAAAVVPLVVTAVSAMDISMNSVSVAARNGEIQIGAFVPSVDVDTDGQTNFRDVVFIHRRLMGLPTVKPEWTLPVGETEDMVNARIGDLQQDAFDGFAPLDVDHDGFCNFRDVVFLHRRLMGLPTVKSEWTLPVGETEAAVNTRIDRLRKL
jgi:uncharacterized repeat protein (TIGR02543 family)